MEVSMIRDNLDNLPEFSLEAPFSLRLFRSGDELEWVKIHKAANTYNNITIKDFERNFGDDPTALHERMFFLCDKNGKAIGTATAWYNPDYHGKNYGRVHWVAIVQDYQGRGLSKPLLSAVCSRLRNLAHSRAYLYTQTERVPAISLYLKFGFKPEIRSEEERAPWAMLKNSHPDIFPDHI